MSGSADVPNNALSRVIDRVTSFFHGVALVTLGVMACLLIYDIIMRYVFHSPTDWVLDVVQLVQVTLAFAAAAPVLRDGGHINMELLSTMVGRRAQRQFDILSNGICTVGSLWMVVLGWRTFSQSYMISESSYGITLPIYPWKFLLPFCFFVLALQFFAMFLNSIRSRV
ncbi:TRAP transporter small permease [Castellaniella sp. GW247-6E4]|uniref:TRAP transporter small permease subunit n=1 Tax=Castellaniella sp. GW247-6E4 TaxID=3140380 RepID=UPI003314D2C8